MKWIVTKWLSLARKFPIVRRIPLIGAGKPNKEKTDESDTDNSGGA